MNARSRRLHKETIIGDNDTVSLWQLNSKSKYFYVSINYGSVRNDMHFECHDYDSAHRLYIELSCVKKIV
jgi:hypothetical protein